jgi:hypothetical protein
VKIDQVDTTGFDAAIKSTQPVVVKFFGKT